MSSSLPLLFVEHPLEKSLVQTLVWPFAVEIEEALTTSGAISAARYALLMPPERPVIALLGTRTENPTEIEEMRGSARRLLAWAALEGWYVALAVPRLDSWALTDPWIKQHMASFLKSETLYADRLARINDLLKTRPFDPTELLRTCPDYKGLMDFLQKHSATQREAAVAH